MRSAHSARATMPSPPCECCGKEESTRLYTDGGGECVDLCDECVEKMGGPGRAKNSAFREGQGDG